MWVWMLWACSNETTDLALWVQDDVAQTARMLGEVGVQPTTVEQCFPVSDSCTLCVSAMGTPLSGTLTAGMENTPCALGDRGYEVTASDFSGMWTGGTAGVEVSIAGERTAAVAGARVDRGATVFTLEQASMALDTAGTVIAFRAQGSYTGLGGRDYSFEVEEFEGALVGQATGPDTTCTIAGTRDNPEVSCER